MKDQVGIYDLTMTMRIDPREDRVGTYDNEDDPREDRVGTYDNEDRHSNFYRVLSNKVERVQSNAP